MAADPLKWLFVTGVVWFPLSVLVLAVASTYYWWHTRRQNPGHLVIWTGMVLSMFYAVQLLDWGFVLRNGDGVEVPWTRGAAQIVAYFLYSWMLAIALWMDWDDTYIAVGAHTLVGVLLLAGDLASGNVGWYFWSVAVALLAAALVFLLRRSRQNSGKAWAMWLGWLIFSVGAPATQAFGWARGQVLDLSPERENTEIAYFVVYSVGLTVYGAVMIWAFSMRPAKTEPSTRPLPTLVPSKASAVASTLTHRTARQIGGEATARAASLVGGGSVRE